MDVNNRGINGQTGLHWAAWLGHEAIVKMVVDEFGADVTIKDNEGRTALDWAIEENPFRAIQGNKQSSE